MIIPGDRDDMIESVCRVHMGKLKKRSAISGIVLSGGMMPKPENMDDIEAAGIPTLITKEDTYSVASRIHSMVVKLKPQDTEKIKIIVDMVEKYVNIDDVISSLR